MNVLIYIYAWDFVSVINGEKAAVNNPLFAQKRERTLEMLIKNIHQGYMMETNKVLYIVLFCVRGCSIFSNNEEKHFSYWLQTDKIYNANNKNKEKISVVNMETVSLKRKLDLDL